MKLMKINLFILLSFLSFKAKGQYDKSESPYILAKTAKEAAQFVLKSTIVDGVLSGPIADIKVRQEYVNTSNVTIEAIYVFPASTRSAVYSMEMKIGDRIIKAEIKEKQKARKMYEQAKVDGKRTTLLEQHRPNIFQMNVANILPGEQIEITLRYTEFIIPTDQIYSFHYPMVVGPRYSGEKQSDWASLSLLNLGTKPQYNFTLNLQLDTAIPIVEVVSKSHRIITSKINDSHIEINLSNAESMKVNKDFILEYALAGNNIETGIKTYSNGKESFFLCQIEAPKLDNKPVIVPREYIFLVDVSGSMSGFPLDISKELMNNLFNRLRPSDKFNIMFFAGQAFMLSPFSLNATPNNIASALQDLRNKKGGGGTNMFDAIKKAMVLPKDEDYSRSFVIVTDGYVTVETEAFEYLNTHLNDANFFAFGIGSSVNRNLIEGLAHVGRGEPFVVTKRADAKHEAEKLRKYIEYPMLTNIKLNSDKVEIYDLIPENIPDLMANRPIYIFGKYKQNNRGNIEIEGYQGCNKFVFSLAFPTASEDAKGLEYLWAREKIRFLDDYNGFGATHERVEEITKLGLKHNLLTKYTSFIAIDQDIINADGNPSPRVQPILSPAGMAEYAIGFELELPVLLKNAETQSAEITVKASNSETKIVLESILEIYFNNPVQHQLLNGTKEIKLKFDKKGNLLIDGSKDLRALKEYIKKSLIKLHYQIGEQEVIIGINIK